MPVFKQYIGTTCQAPPENSTAIVLGAQVKPWGPSVILRGRIDAAKSYLDDSPNANAVLSGGQGSDEIMEWRVLRVTVR